VFHPPFCSHGALIRILGRLGSVSTNGLFWCRSLPPHRGQPGERGLLFCSGVLAFGFTARDFSRQLSVPVRVSLSPFLSSPLFYFLKKGGRPCSVDRTIYRFRQRFSSAIILFKPRPFFQPIPLQSPYSLAAFVIAKLVTVFPRRPPEGSPHMNRRTPLPLLSAAMMGPLLFFCLPPAKGQEVQSGWLAQYHVGLTRSSRTFPQAVALGTLFRFSTFLERFPGFSLAFLGDRVSCQVFGTSAQAVSCPSRGLRAPPGSSLG